MKLPNIEVVAAKVHEAWMDSKRAQGVTTRLAEDGEELMVPYAGLSEKAKELDRGTVKAVYAAIETAQQDEAAQRVANGQRIVNELHQSPYQQYDGARDTAHGR